MVRIGQLPLALLIAQWFLLLMFVPACYGLATGSSETGRIFLYTAILGTGLSFGIQLSIGNRKSKEDRRALLLTLLFVFMAIPIGLAIPMVEAIQNTSFLNAYLDMVSAITTTALPVYTDGRLNDTLILWRSLVAWSGGLFIWTVALVIFMPMRMGGFEVLHILDRYFSSAHQSKSNVDAMTIRFLKELWGFAPIYLGLTFSVFLALMFTGVQPFDAAIFAMGVVSTAGYLPNGVDLWTSGGFMAEITVWVALLFAVTRRMFGTQFALVKWDRISQDQELRLAFSLVIGVTVLLFVRHFLGAVTVQNTDDSAHLGQAIWGGLFTSLSFLTTTGYISEGWVAAQNWSGLENSGMILITLSVIGGGAATTAGGIKLLRITSLVRHSLREIEQLTSPNRVIASKKYGVGNKVENAIWAWVFFMLFFFAFALFFLCFTVSGASFEEGLVLTAAALSNTGPIVGVVENVRPNVLALDDFGKLVMSAAMVLGRVETLAILALFNPDIWRR